ncbi:MAG: NFACT RNA binding domain-containing protein, partial [Thermoplasmatota archaeon]
MAKSEVNSFDVLAASRELHALAGARLDKAYQPEPDLVVLRLRPKRDIYLGAGRFVFVTDTIAEMPQEPPTFAVALRKHLAGARLEGARQLGFDRVLELDFARGESVYTLVTELFHDGNVLLVQNGKIIAALSHQRFADRKLRVGAEYVSPPARIDPRLLSFEEFAPRVAASTADVVRTLATELNLGGQYAEEVALRAGVAKAIPAATLDASQSRALYDALLALLRAVEHAPEPAVAAGDCAPVPLKVWGDAPYERSDSMLAALARIFAGRIAERKEREDPRAKRTREEREKFDRMIAAQREAIAKFEVEDRESRLKAELLYAHFQICEETAQRVLGAAREFGWKEVTKQLKGAREAGQEYAHRDVPADANTSRPAPLGAFSVAAAGPVESIDPATGTAVFALPDAHGKLMRAKYDLKKSVQENANDFYARSKKFREKLVGAKRALAVSEARLAEALARGAAVESEMEKARTRAKPTKRFPFEAYRWFFTTTGHMVLAGKDAASNEKLVKKMLDDRDRYVHAETNGAPSVVVKASGDAETRSAVREGEAADTEGGRGTIPEAALVEAAGYAVSMSRAWQHGLAAGEAYWVTPAQVSKTPNPGEYVARGAFIIRGKRNYLRVPIRLAVGEVEVEGARKIMGAPLESVKARSSRYVVIEPGQEKKDALANRLAKAFDVPVEEVQAVLPPGDVRVV